MILTSPRDRFPAIVEEINASIRRSQPQPSAADLLQHADDLERCAEFARSPASAQTFREAAAIARAEAASLIAQAA